MLFARTTIPTRKKALDKQVDERGSWTMLSNHGHALLYLAIRPDTRLWELAAQLGIRERSAHRIVSELAAAGYVHRQRRGRRVIYNVDRSRGLRRPDLSHTGSATSSTSCTPPTRTAPPTRRDVTRATVSKVAPPVPGGTDRSRCYRASRT
jgi:hypothetical protein